MVILRQSQNVKIIKECFLTGPTLRKGASDENENQLSAHWRYRGTSAFDSTRGRHQNVESYRNEQRGSCGYIRSGRAVGHREIGRVSTRGYAHRSEERRVGKGWRWWWSVTAVEEGRTV